MALCTTVAPLLYVLVGTKPNGDARDTVWSEPGHEHLSRVSDTVEHD
jgi:hypothetical protein